MIKSGRAPVSESVDRSDIKKGQYVVINIEYRLSSRCQLVAAKIESVSGRMVHAWAWMETMHEYDIGAIVYIAKSYEDAENFIKSNKSKTVKELKDLKESVENPVNESTYDGDTVNWNKISAGDVVGWTIEGMGRLPKVGDDFRVGPFIGKCTKVSGSKVYMKVESDSRELNESSKFNASTSDSKVAAEVRKLVKKAKESNDAKDAWAVVDFLHDFPNALCESVDSMNESTYYVSGSTPTGEGDSNVDTSGKITDPAKAIEQWFKLGAKHRSGTAITAMTKKDAIALVTWANENKDKITEWHAKYKCPYKLESILDGIANQVRRKCSSFYESEFGDMVYPFDVG